MYSQQAMNVNHLMLDQITYIDTSSMRRWVHGAYNASINSWFAISRTKFNWFISKQQSHIPHQNHSHSHSSAIVRKQLTVKLDFGEICAFLRNECYSEWILLGIKSICKMINRVEVLHFFVLLSRLDEISARFGRNSWKIY